MENKTGLVWGIVVLVGVVVVGIIFRFHTSAGPAPVVTVENTASTTTTVTTATTTTAIVKGVPSNTVVFTGTAGPSYNTPLTFAATVSADAKSALQKQFDEVVAGLKKDPTRGELWFSLGTIRKGAGDYAGAIEDWNFIATSHNSLSAAAYGNLADLYMNFLKDYPKAEQSYLKAIQLEPANPQSYEDLFTLYTATPYRSSVSASAGESILKKGIAANPKAVELQVILARYYVSVGRKADAKMEFEAAIANANGQGNAALAAQVQQEEASLKP